MSLARLFWNQEEKRPTALWRILIFVAIYIALGMFSGDLIYSLVSRLTPILDPALGSEPAMLLTSLIRMALYFGLLAATIALACRFLDRRRFVDLGLHLSRQWWLDLGFGLALGALLMGLVFVIELVFGWITITGMFHTDPEGFSLIPGLLRSVCFALAVGIVEELFAHGYLLKNMTEGLAHIKGIEPRTAIVGSVMIASLLFGLLHAGNPDATVQSTLNIFIASLFVVIPWGITGELGLPIGFHIGWNFFEGTVFGFALSGLSTEPRIFAIEQGGSRFLTGGAFGPEGGLILFLMMPIGAALTLAWIKRTRGSLQWKRELASPVLLPDSGAETSILPT